MNVKQKNSVHFKCSENKFTHYLRAKKKQNQVRKSDKFSLYGTEYTEKYNIIYLIWVEQWVNLGSLIYLRHMNKCANNPDQKEL